MIRRTSAAWPHIVRPSTRATQCAPLKNIYTCGILSNYYAPRVFVLNYSSVGANPTCIFYKFLGFLAGVKFRVF